MTDPRKLHDGILAVGATITYMPGVHDVGLRVSLEVNVHYVYVTVSGWLRVTWLDGQMTMLSPAAVREVNGKGVEYA